MAGAQTLDTIRRRMADSLGLTYDQMSDDEVARLTSWANESLQKFCNEGQWSFLQDKRATVTITGSGTGRVDLPADFGSIPEDAIPYIAGSVPGPMIPVGLEWIDRQTASGTVYGNPERYAIGRNHTTNRYQLVVWPVPTSNTDATVSYEVVIADMSDPDDVPGIPAALHYAYLLCALDYAHRMHEKADKTAYSVDYDRALQAAFRKHLMPNRTSTEPLERVVNWIPNDIDGIPEIVPNVTIV